MTNKRTGLNRVLKLADYVEKIKPSKFDFDVIVGDDWKGMPNLSCGTTACAIGWATTMPLFRKLGLYLKRGSYGGGSVYLNYSSDWEYIGRKVFAINESAMMALFQPYTYNPDFDEGYPYLPPNATPKQWAKHARAIVKILEKE